MVVFFSMLMLSFLPAVAMFPAQIYEREHRVLHHSFPQDILYSQIMRMERQHQKVKTESATKRRTAPAPTLNQLQAFRNLLEVYKKVTGGVAPGEIGEYKNLSPGKALELFKTKTSDTIEQNEVLRNAYYFAQRSLGTIGKKDAFTSPDRRKQEMLRFIGVKQPQPGHFAPIDLTQQPSPHPVERVEEQVEVLLPASSSSSSSSLADAPIESNPLVTPPRRPVRQPCFVPVAAESLVEDFKPAQPLQTSPKSSTKALQRKRSRSASSMYTQQDKSKFKSFFVPASQNNNNHEDTASPVEPDVYEDSTKRQRTD